MATDEKTTDLKVDDGNNTPTKHDGLHAPPLLSLPGPVQAQVHRNSWKPKLSRKLVLVALVLVFYTARFIWSQGTDGFVPGQQGPHHHHKKPPHRLWGKKAEKLFLSVPTTESATEASRKYTAVPHVAGSEGDLTTAKYFLTLLQTELGIHTHPHSPYPLFAAGSHESQRATRGIPHLYHPKAWIDTYYPVMNTPLERSLQILDEDGKVLWEADLKERSDGTDADAEKYSDAVPTFHGLSKGGDVTGHLVDGNYCTKDDYDNLVSKSAKLEGSIVLCRYGGIFRGLKVKGGQEVGAVGVLIYSDPRDDGSVTLENGYSPYPNGPSRNPTSVQRGSVQFLSAYPGDPTTPGYPSYENSTRTEGSNIPSIPSLPISWMNAKNLLETLKSGSLLEGKKVRLLNNVDTRVIPIWNTMGVIPGYITNEVVVIGNHRDAWVLGAADPTSGTASIHEVIRGLGALIKKGWKPMRTIVIASWDAEEYGLIGSTEWGEDFEDWIGEHVVAYFNLDGSVSGSRLSASGSPLLSHFIKSVALDIPHPTDKSRTLWDARNDHGKYFGHGNVTIAEETLAIKEMETSAMDDVGVSVLGSGSDYTVFLQRSGIPSTGGVGFGSTLQDPVYHYHSVFDSEQWMEKYADPGFFRHVAAAKHLGLQTIRFSSSIVLPFNTTHYSYELESYLDRVENIAASQNVDVHFSSLRKSIHSLQEASADLDKEKVEAVDDLKKIIKEWKKKDRRIKKKIRKIICRIKRKLGRKCHRHHRKGAEAKEDALAIAGATHHMPAHARLGRAPGLLAEQQMMEANTEYAMAVAAGFDGPRCEFNRLLADHEASQDSRPRRPKFPIAKLRQAIKRIQANNKKLSSFERGFISEEGIKDREWFKHLAVAPGKWLGYGATTFPALTEALTYEKNSTLAQEEAERLRVLIDKLVVAIKV